MTEPDFISQFDEETTELFGWFNDHGVLTPRKRYMTLNSAKSTIKA